MACTFHKYWLGGCDTSAYSTTKYDNTGVTNQATMVPQEFVYSSSGTEFFKYKDQTPWSASLDQFSQIGTPEACADLCLAHGPACKGFIFAPM